jgi:perosamine synthetase
MEKNIKERIESMTISSRGTIREAIAAIGKGKFGVALLIDPDTGIFEGLINDGDIRRAFLKGSGLNSPVDEVAHPKTVTMKAGAPSHEIIKKFSKRIRVIPILDEKGYVVDLYTFDRRVNIPVAEPKFQEIDLSYITECILTGWVSSSGKFVKRFEELFAKFCHAKFAVSTTSGTTALHLALVVLGVGPGDEVIVPTLTFIATANAVRYTGAQPVFVDSDSETWNINAAEIELAITSKTKAIIPVHLYGHPANMDPIIKIAAKHGLAVVEDAAEAHGALYKNKNVGSLGDIGIFSFFGNKIITTGEGGMVVTNNGALAEKIRILRDHGMDENRRYWHTVLGYNYRMTNIQAALGVAQMERIGYILERKRKIALAYHKALKDLPGITLPPEAKWAKNVFWMYSILIDGKQFGMTRDELMERLESKGIETRPIFPPVHIQPIYATGQNLPIAERLAVQGLNLPSSINLTQRDIARIADLIAGFSQAS